MAEFSKLIWRENETPGELHSLLTALGDEYDLRPSGRGLRLRFRRTEQEEASVRVTRSRGEVLIEYNRINAAARGIGAALAGLSGEESTPFETLGIMLDVSRAMVMTVDHFKSWLRRLALAGANLAMLYTEDVYTLDGEPYFGYMRGAYTLEEIRELDAYAQSLGIEMIGCIQVLGHLEQILRWNAYDRVRDTGQVLMADDQASCELIEKMVDFWDRALGSRRIHIGMDEAWDLGRGRYQNLHGAPDEFKLFNRHLDRVNAICRRHDLTPIIWSDMYFRLGNPEHLYYCLRTNIPPEVQSAIPRNVQLVYWDYYNEDPEVYSTMIRLHREIGFEPIMAGGIWTWRRFWHDFNQTRCVARPCIEACRREKVRELFFCLWGNSNAACDFDSALAGIFYTAGLAWGCDDEKQTAKRFEAACFASYAAHRIAGEIDLDLRQRKISGVVSSENCRSADRVVDIMLVWDDPLLGIAYNNYKLIDPEFDRRALAHYQKLIEKLLPFCEDNAAGDLGHAVNLLKLLALKLELRSELVAAYADRDRVALREIAATLVPAAVAALWEFDASLRRQWLRYAKPFGLERIQVRNAGVAARLEETAVRINEWLDGDVDRIEELEVTPPSGSPQSIGRYKQIYTGYWEL